MKSNLAGVCVFENFKLEYQVEYLEYIPNKSLNIKAICFNPYNVWDREAVFKYSTNNLSLNDPRLQIAISMIEGLVKDLNLQNERLFKLVVRNKQAFYIKD